MRTALSKYTWIIQLSDTTIFESLREVDGKSCPSSSTLLAAILLSYNARASPHSRPERATRPAVTQGEAVSAVQAEAWQCLHTWVCLLLLVCPRHGACVAQLAEGQDP